MAKKRYKYNFAKKKHSEKGVTSSVFAGISLGIFCIAAICSLAFHGKRRSVSGGYGLIAIGLSIYGFILGLKKFGRKTETSFFCKIGAAGNGVAYGYLAGAVSAGTCIKHREGGKTYGRAVEKADGFFAGSG